MLLRYLNMLNIRRQASDWQQTNSDHNYNRCTETKDHDTVKK